MTDLSENARVVLGSTFGWAAVVTFHMIESAPSPEMQLALDELVAAGCLIREQGLPDMTSAAIRYRVADGVDLAPYRKEVWDLRESGMSPQIRMFVPRGAK